jgi:hypothetical protein
LQRKTDTPISDVYTRRKTREETVYFIKQKLAGLVLCILGVLSAIVAEGDATAALMVIPLGIFVMLTKNKVMMY